MEWEHGLPQDRTEARLQLPSHTVPPHQYSLQQAMQVLRVRHLDANGVTSSCVGFACRPGQLSCYILELPDVDGDQAISLIQEGSFPDFAGRDSVVIHRKRLNSTIDVCEESDYQRITIKRACEEAVSGFFTEGQVLYVDSPCVTLVNTKLCPAGRRVPGCDPSRRQSKWSLLADR